MQLYIYSFIINKPINKLVFMCLYTLLNEEFLKACKSYLIICMAKFRLQTFFDLVNDDNWCIKKANAKCSNLTCWPIKIHIEPFVFGLNLHFVAVGKCAFKSKPSKQQPSKQNIVLVGVFLEWSKSDIVKPKDL